jgi:PAS domain S-box-containing protein
MSKKVSPQVLSKKLAQQDPFFFQEITEAVPALIGVYNIVTGEYVYVNQTVEKILGYSRSEFMKGGVAHLVTLMHPDDIKPVMEKNLTALETANKEKPVGGKEKMIADFEYRMKHKNGSWLWLKTYGSVFKRTKTGKVEYVLNVSFNISKRKAAEERAKEVLHNKQIGSMIEHMDDDFISIDRKGNYLYVNERTAMSLKMDKKDFHGKNIWSVFPQLKKTSLLLNVQEVMRTNKPVKHEFQGFLSPGWFSASIYPTEEGVIIYFTDITERKQTEEKLQKSEERLALALKSSQMGIWDWDIATNKISWSEQLERLFGLKPGTFGGSFEQYTSMIHPDDRERFQQVIQGARKSGKQYQVEHRVIWPDGSTHWILGLGQAYYDPKTKKPIRMIGSSQNIDERKKNEERKDDFIGMASHELKTPVTSLKIFTQILKRQFEKEGKSLSGKYLEKMDDQINKLTRLIRELLDVSKISAGKLKITKTKCDLREVTKEIIEYLQETTKQKITLKASRGVVVFADRDRLEQVIINLLTNAIKYSNGKGDIEILISKKAKAVTLGVKDKGIGIGKEHKDRIFERFYQVTSAPDSAASGLGMGLYIAHQIVMLHKGQLFVESEKGKGSTFSFTLPLP